MSIFDGLFFGGFFFIFIPICYSFWVGKIQLVGLPDFLPEKDCNIIFYGIFSITFFGICSLQFSNKKKFLTRNLKVVEKNFFVLTLLMYFFSLIVSFISSGKLDGGSHWYRANEDLYQKSAMFVLLGQIHNVGRVVIPGLCLYFQLHYLRTNKFFKPHFFIAFFVIVFELFLAGNRIVILFFVFSIIIPFAIRKKIKEIFYIAIICFPILFIAKFWPMVRGMIWAEKVSIERTVDVIKLAYKSEVVANDSESDAILVLTEGSNLVALKYITDNFPNKYDYSLGETMVLKSIGAIIPKSIWPSKPDGLGNLVGEKALSGFSLYLNVTLLGDAWANFSFYGIFYIVLMLFIIEKYFKKSLFKLLSSIFFMVAIASWRFDFSYYFITIYILLFYFLILKISIVNKMCNKISFLIFKN
ncbi:hypothetical protein [Flavobacterium hungaricum]|uniref:Oligosaccharide repeat unit polymerase n=1 Tax=Flavobacterium hungaricum TaxID=2082725 RepID=A0ABR9TNV8_9FLAO|nr:hypothetical protein [Flavobacterium hungaricum]MBE8727053.1 hypothetical protein [Flavobacterium hungaricum]